MAAPTSVVDTVVSLCKRRGFVFPCGEIYGGTRSAWDYGPLGVELKENIKRQWWRSMVTAPRRRRRPRLLDHPARARPGWRRATSATFTDPLTECQSCHKRFRADHLQEASPTARQEGQAVDPDSVALADIACPNCGTRGQWTEPRNFNMMLKTYLGVDRGRVGPALPAARDRPGHLRQLPQRQPGLAQEAAVRHRPDRQELPQRDHPRQLHLPHPRVRADGDGVLRQARRRRASGTSTGSTSAPRWYTDLGIDPDNLRHYEHPEEKLSHYSKRTVDIEYRFGFTGSEWGELEGIANRTDFDLTTHSEHSGTDLSTSTRPAARSTRRTSSSRPPA